MENDLIVKRAYAYIYVFVNGVRKDIANDAANIYSDNYDEYMAIWRYLYRMFPELY